LFIYVFFLQAVQVLMEVDDPTLKPDDVHQPPETTLVHNSDLQFVLDPIDVTLHGNVYRTCHLTIFDLKCFQ